MLLKISQSTFAVMLASTLVLGHGPPAEAATFNVPCSVPELVRAIATANQSPGPSTVVLEPFCTYSLKEVDNHGLFGDNGLPVIKGSITMRGDATTIERSMENETPMFRLMQVNKGARLTLKGLTLRNGVDNSFPQDEKGGAILNKGILEVSDGVFTNNLGGCGGAIWSDNALTVKSTVFRGNTGDG